MPRWKNLYGKMYERDDNMTGTELMELLDKRLSILNETEREDIKQDYAQHIEMKMSEGMTEEEAVGTLGDIGTIIDETLMAYNIDPSYDKKSEAGQKIRKALNSEFAQKTGETLNKGLDAVHNAVKANSPEELIKLLVKIFGFCLGAFVLFVFGYLIVNLGTSIIHGILPSTFGLDRIVPGGIKLLYIIIFAILVFSAAYNFIQNGTNKISKDIQPADSGETVDVTDGAPKKEAKKMNDTSVSTKLFDIFVFIIKICVVFAILPCIFMLIGTILAQGFLAAAVFMGYPAIGLCIGCLGVNVCTITFLIFVFKLVFGERRDKNEA